MQSRRSHPLKPPRDAIPAFASCAWSSPLAFPLPCPLPPPSRTHTASSSQYGGRLRPRAKTSSERGRYFRQRQKAHEEELERQVQQLRKQVAHLRSTRSVYAQKALLTRTSPCGSLVQLTRELYRVYRNGLETIDPMMMTMVATTEAERAQRQSLLSRVQYKEDFLHKVLDPEVVRGDLVGVDAIIAQWRKHTASYAKFEIELGPVEAIVGSKKNPIVVIQTKMHARFGHETFQVVFPFVRGRRDDLVGKLSGKDVTFDCVSRFHFSDAGQITMYSLEVSFVETLTNVLGNVRDVAELMRLSVMSPDSTYIDAAPIALDDEVAASSWVHEHSEPRIQEVLEVPRQSGGAGPRSGKMCVEYLLDLPPHAAFDNDPIDGKNSARRYPEPFLPQDAD